MTRTCYECEGRLRVRQKNYKYKECGLQNVVLKDITVYECESCGAEQPEIPAMASLHRNIMLAVLKKESLLTGEEIRFLRKMAALTASEMSRLMGVTPTQVSKWENNARKISAPSDRVLRLICYSGFLEKMVKDLRGLTNETAAVAKTAMSLDVRSWLRNIEKHVRGSKRVTIDPRLVSGEDRRADDGMGGPAPSSEMVQ
jgi:putative zinc finger/helix-turn-helix YgiT family protein